jgi:MFS family permease
MEKNALANGRKKSLEYSVKDGAAFSIMTGFGEQYFTPLAIELGASNMGIGLLASLPPFIASLPQLFTSRVTTLLKSRRKIILIAVMLQVLTWVPLAALPLLGYGDAIPLLIVLVSLYFMFGQFANPTWNSLMGDLVNEEMRGRFFGMRNKITGAVAFVSIFTAGYILSLFSKDTVLYGFSMIFFIALLARLISWRYLSLIEDPPMGTDRAEVFSFMQYLRRLRKTNYGRFALYYGLMNFSVYVAAPFFAVYMLKDLHFTYFEYTVATAAMSLTGFLSMTYWGNLADRFGNKKILSLCGTSLAIVPLLWLFSADVVSVVLIQVLAGIVWSGYTLSALNIVYDNVRPQNRTRVFAYHNILAASSIFLGAMVGACLSSEITDHWIFYSSLQIIFLVSAILRLTTSALFLPLIKERRRVEPISERDFFIKYSGTGPAIGLSYRAVTGLRRSIKKIGKKEG